MKKDVGSALSRLFKSGDFYYLWKDIMVLLFGPRLGNWLVDPYYKYEQAAKEYKGVDGGKFVNRNAGKWGAEEDWVWTETVVKIKRKHYANVYRIDLDNGKREYIFTVTTKPTRKSVSCVKCEDYDNAAGSLDILKSAYRDCKVTIVKSIQESNSIESSFSSRGIDHHDERTEK